MSTRKLFIAALGVGLGIGALAARGDDWPRFRGPNNDNISKETGLLKQWPEGGPKLAWKVKGIGTGHSTVSVVGGKIYTMGDLDDSAQVICLDAKDGKKLWTTKVGQAGGRDRSPERPGTRGTPTVDGDRVYALGQYGNLVCLKASDGSLIWQKDLAKDMGGKVGGWDYSESPLVDGDKLVVTPGGPQGTLAALNKMTGEVIWRTTDWKDNAEYVSPILATIDGVKQYIQIGKNSVAGISADDGRVLWTGPIPRNGRNVAIASSPLYADNHVFLSAGYGNGCNLLKITKQGNAFKAEEVYHDTDLASHHGGVILLDGFVYGASDPGLMTCLNFKTGDVAWKQRVAKGSITYADGHIVLRSERGPVTLLEANPRELKVKGEFEQPDRSGKPAWPYPVISDGRLYLRDHDTLLVYDVRGNSTISRAE